MNNNHQLVLHIQDKDKLFSVNYKLLVCLKLNLSFQNSFYLYLFLGIFVAIYQCSHINFSLLYEKQAVHSLMVVLNYVYPLGHQLLLEYNLLLIDLFFLATSLVKLQPFDTITDEYSISFSSHISNTFFVILLITSSANKGSPPYQAIFILLILSDFAFYKFN